MGEAGQIRAGVTVAVGFGETAELVHDPDDAAVGGGGDAVVAHAPHPIVPAPRANGRAVAEVLARRCGRLGAEEKFAANVVAAGVE